MAMSRFLLLQCLLMFTICLLGVWAKTKAPTYHYHRSLYSDYRAQHNPRIQRGYKRHRPFYPVVKTTPKMGKSKEPLISIGTAGMQVHLHDLLVRIYNNGQFLCVGTLITDRMIATAATCFANVELQELTIKTFDNHVMPATRKNSSENFRVDANSLLAVLELQTAAGNSSVATSAARLCDITLQPRFIVELPTYIRTRHGIHTQTTEVLNLVECRKRMKDPNGQIVRDSMICVKNTKYTSKCQKTFGNPLIYDGKICAINVMGHNCPQAYGVDIYDMIYNAADYVGERIKFLKGAQMDVDII